jgi:hypothetical protein
MLEERELKEWEGNGSLLKDRKILSLSLCSPNGRYD